MTWYGGVYLGPENRKTARNFGKKRKTARKIGENRKTGNSKLLALTLYSRRKNGGKINKTAKPMKITPHTEKPHSVSAKTTNRRTHSKPKNRTKNREKPKNRTEKGQKPQNGKQVDPLHGIANASLQFMCSLYETQW